MSPKNKYLPKIQLWWSGGSYYCGNFSVDCKRKMYYIHVWCRITLLCISFGGFLICEIIRFVISSAETQTQYFASFPPWGLLLWVSIAYKAFQCLKQVCLFRLAQKQHSLQLATDSRNPFAFIYHSQTYMNYECNYGPKTGLMIRQLVK